MEWLSKGPSVATLLLLPLLLPKRVQRGVCIGQATLLRVAGVGVGSVLVVRYYCSKAQAAARWSSAEARMKELLAFLLVATGVAWAFAQTVVPGTSQGVSGAPLTVMTESLQTRQGR